MLPMCAHVCEGVWVWQAAMPQERIERSTKMEGGRKGGRQKEAETCVLAGGGAGTCQSAFEGAMPPHCPVLSGGCMCPWPSAGAQPHVSAITSCVCHHLVSSASPSAPSLQLAAGVEGEPLYMREHEDNLYNRLLHIRSVYVCMCVHTHVCMYVYAHACMYTRMHVCSTPTVKQTPACVVCVASLPRCLVCICSCIQCVVSCGSRLDVTPEYSCAAMTRPPPPCTTLVPSLYLYSCAAVTRPPPPLPLLTSHPLNPTLDIAAIAQTYKETQVTLTLTLGLVLGGEGHNQGQVL